jgi:hypothetical protein
VRRLPRLWADADYQGPIPCSRSGASPDSWNLQGFPKEPSRRALPGDFDSPSQKPIECHRRLFLSCELNKRAVPRTIPRVVFPTSRGILANGYCQPIKRATSLYGRCQRELHTYSIVQFFPPREAASQSPLNISSMASVAQNLTENQLCVTPCAPALHAPRYAMVSCLDEIASTGMVFPVSCVTGTTAPDNLDKIQRQQESSSAAKGHHHGQAHSLSHLARTTACMTCRATWQIQSSLDLAWGGFAS